MPQAVLSVAVLFTLVTTFNVFLQSYHAFLVEVPTVHIIVHFYWYSSISEYFRSVKVKFELFVV
jgi:hypothetical protein